jgi:hypothetical protein
LRAIEKVNQHGLEIVTDSQLVDIHHKIIRQDLFLYFIKLSIIAERVNLFSLFFSSNSSSDIEYALADLEKLFQ